MTENLSGSFGLLLRSDPMSKANADPAAYKTIAPTIAETIERRVRKYILILQAYQTDGCGQRMNLFRSIALLHPVKYSRPIVQRRLISGHELNHELVEASIAERADSFAQFGRGRSEAGRSDEFRGEEFLLFGPHPNQVHLVHLKIACVGGLVGRILLAIRVEHRRNFRRQLQAEARFDQSMQEHHRNGTRLRLRARAGGRFAIGQDASERKRSAVEILRRAT